MPSFSLYIQNIWLYLGKRRKIYEFDDIFYPLKVSKLILFHFNTVRLGEVSVAYLIYDKN